MREAAFPGDRRKISDFCRSGVIEAVADHVDSATLAGKMANSIDSTKELQRTYLLNNAAVVRLADAARPEGAERWRQEVMIKVQ